MLYLIDGVHSNQVSLFEKLMAQDPKHRIVILLDSMYVNPFDRANLWIKNLLKSTPQIFSVYLCPMVSGEYFLEFSRFKRLFGEGKLDVLCLKHSEYPNPESLINFLGESSIRGEFHPPEPGMIHYAIHKYRQNLEETDFEVCLVTNSQSFLQTAQAIGINYCLASDFDEFLHSL